MEGLTKLNNLMLFVGTFVVCLFTLLIWNYLIQKNNEANKNIKNIQKSNPYKINTPKGRK